MKKQKLKTELETHTTIWKHPYFVYILLTTALFLFLLLISWIAWTNGWIPDRGKMQ